jgi:hypothetical protein
MLAVTKPLALAAEIFAAKTPGDPGFWLCFAALPVLTYLKYAPLRFSLDCARNRACRAGNWKIFGSITR